MMALCGVAISLVLSFLESYSHTIGASAGASWFFVVMAACTFTSRIFVGRIQDRFGDDVVIYPIFVCMAIAYILLATAQGASGLWLWFPHAVRTSDRGEPVAGGALRDRGSDVLYLP